MHKPARPPFKKVCGIKTEVNGILNHQTDNFHDIPVKKS